MRVPAWFFAGLNGLTVVAGIWLLNAVGIFTPDFSTKQGIGIMIILGMTFAALSYFGLRELRKALKI